MMSATDPVATIAVLNEVGAPRQLRTLIEGESLVNDGTAYVLFFLLRVRRRRPCCVAPKPAHAAKCSSWTLLPWGESHKIYISGPKVSGFRVSVF